MIAFLPPRSSSTCARARMTIRPRPVRYASRTPERPTMMRAGREVRALDVLHEILDARGRLVDERDDRVDRLGEVVRRDVRRHSDRDARRAVDEEVREARRQDLRLAARLVVVRRRSRPCPSRCRAASPSRASRGGTRCSARRPAGRRRSSRSCPGRRRAGSEARTAARGGRSRRRSSSSRAGGTCP